MTVDRLEQGPVRRTPRLRLLVAVLVPVALVAAAVDHIERRSERSALAACVRGAEVQVTHAVDLVRGVADYASPSLSSPLVTLSVRRSLRAIVQDAAGQGVDPLRRQRTACARTHVVVWHLEMRHAREAYLAYLDAEGARFAAVAGDFGNYGVADTATAQARAEALRALARVGISP